MAPGAKKKSKKQKASQEERKGVIVCAKGRERGEEGGEKILGGVSNLLLGPAAQGSD